MIFFFLENAVLNQVPSYAGFFQGVRDAAVELLHTLVAVHAEVIIACHKDSNPTFIFLRDIRRVVYLIRQNYHL